MSDRWRLGLMTAALLALALPAAAVIVGLPRFGDGITAYGAAINALGPGLRHIPNMVALVNFDMRALDTLGEESMLLCAVTGAVVLLRGDRGESRCDRANRLAGRALEPRSDAAVVVCRWGSPFLVLFGIYIALHGLLTPGGGFQGGVIAASGLVLLYLGEGYGAWRSFVRGRAASLLEGTGVLVYAAAAGLPLLAGRAALENILPLGSYGQLFSGGLMLAINLAVFCAVSGGFALLILEFMEETRAEDDADGDAG
ncbi:MnhB domain-containing protein [Mesorhizobium sp. SP-1A]|uniref:MnhB domain-containing protein n=1 Tax=Mesorhizobium sp. SP-1A TaxID=3077840 RepID=UPI0028F72032|nr:MnhB domain-containing protein [Mesorhizobium sp. SP-1A]